ncbi:MULTISPECIES: OmpA family protein [Bradyrhizobium]|jgi:OmpA-OmpF porin, OOP family|nr:MULTISPECIES: OmpA family protein [Bradyrhizobium]MCP1933699.1 outer membrane protein OmpA-like peptidoglycan-associated protein [Bradyrhizobium elkanii]MCP1967864.1 outer membrane protein OmpA-like peptidoglycan-associated protein [Bradyrhizobium elkanii]MCS3478293.1 outer membrane protein OmpA-like peptidoglycan-associated protein [Bradyrhizobium elkanii]MCS3524156.1 outer membrane protein OmpA-like peptidoglycan-associated protein [Bradyrhizobium elkanii]MCS3585066.1 outer membrane prote
MMRLSARGTREISLSGLLGALLVLAMPLSPMQAQTAVTRDDIIAKLNHFETDAAIDVPALRLQTLERSKSRSRNEPPPSSRPPIAPDLTKLPAFNVDVRFDVDTPIVMPESYATVGRIADALTHSALLPYTFLIVGHIESGGRRDNNVLLSQRRADAIRDILVNTYKIAPKRLQSVGLGEEQLLDPARPNAPVNSQVQIMLVAKLADAEPPAHPAPAAAAKKPAKSAKKH